MQKFIINNLKSPGKYANKQELENCSYV